MRRHICTSTKLTFATVIFGSMAVLSAGSGVISESMWSAMHGLFVNFPLAYLKLRETASGQQSQGRQ
jgi:hypothetical protein